MLKKYESFSCLQALKTLQVNVNDPRIIECKVSYLYDLLVQPCIASVHTWTKLPDLRNMSVL